MIQVKKEFHADGVHGVKGETVTKEMWSKISPRSQKFLDDNGFLESVPDMTPSESLSEQLGAEIVDGKNLDAKKPEVKK